MTELQDDIDRMVDTIRSSFVQVIKKVDAQHAEKARNAETVLNSIMCLVNACGVNKAIEQRLASIEKRLEALESKQIDTTTTGKCSSCPIIIKEEKEEKEKVFVKQEKQIELVIIEDEDEAVVEKEKEPPVQEISHVEQEIEMFANEKEEEHLVQEPVLEEKQTEEEQIEQIEESKDDDIETETSSVHDDEDEQKDEKQIEQQEEEEEDDEEVFEIDIDDVTYFTNNEENGIIYEKDANGDPGKKVGIIKDGEPILD